MIIQKYYCHNDDYKIVKKRKYEKDMMLFMIKLYCMDNHKDYQKTHSKTFGSKNICKECEELYNYACERTDRCRFIKEKTFCSACQSHCYKKDMKEKVKKIMSYSGKRMILHHPIAAFKHVFVMMKHNMNKNKKLDFKGVI